MNYVYRGARGMATRDDLSLSLGSITLDSQSVSDSEPILTHYHYLLDQFQHTHLHHTQDHYRPQEGPDTYARRHPSCPHIRDRYLSISTHLYPSIQAHVFAGLRNYIQCEECRRQTKKLERKSCDLCGLDNSPFTTSKLKRKAFVDFVTHSLPPLTLQIAICKSCKEIIEQECPDEVA